MERSTAARGQQGERVARKHLERAGFRFVAANWLCRFGEIDLIMRDGSTLVFVEVRLRSSAAYGEAADTVNWHKQAKLIRAARFYQQQEDWWGDVRFDVVSLTSKGEDAFSVDHIAHAFEASSS